VEYFDAIGIVPGAELKVLRRNYDGTLSLRLRDKPTNLGKSAATKVWVSRARRRPEHAV
jgi:Fe2+ transport system protein FeoA